MGGFNRNTLLGCRIKENSPRNESPGGLEASAGGGHGDFNSVLHPPAKAAMSLS